MKEASKRRAVKQVTFWGNSPCVPLGTLRHSTERMPESFPIRGPRGWVLWTVSRQSLAEGCHPGLVQFLGTSSCSLCKESWLWPTDSQVKGIWKSGWCVTRSLGDRWFLPAALHAPSFNMAMIHNFGQSVSPYFPLPTNWPSSSDSLKRELGRWVSHCHSIGQSPWFRSSWTHTGQPLAALESGGQGQSAVSREVSQSLEERLLVGPSVMEDMYHICTAQCDSH